MNFPEFGVRRPITNLMIFCVIILLALYSLTRIGLDNFPQIEPPVITVISNYPGSSPEDVEAKVTEQLENQLGTTPGLEKITSISAEGISVISLKFSWGTNLDEASNDIRDRIDLSKRFLPSIPDEMDNPFIFKFNTANIPILFIGITADDSYPGLYDMIDQQVADNLRQLPGVGTVQFQGGGMERQINVWIDRQRLEGYGFSILDVIDVLKKENVTQPVGNLKSGLSDYLLRVPGEFVSPEDISHVILGKRLGRVVYLRDVARIEDGFKEITSIVRINQKPGLTMMIQKQSGTNSVEVTRRVKKRLKELTKKLPKDVRLTTIFDTSQDIINSIKTLSDNVWIAIVLVIFVVWFFLRQIRSSLIVALTIPFSLMISFVYLFLSGKTINVISLSSLAIASGMVVDNAIVVVDNIVRHVEKGQRLRESAIFGTSEIFLAIGASALTTVVVFVPLLFVPGVVGIMFGELAMIVIVTLVASLFTATTFTPMLCAKWLRPNSAQSSLKKSFAKRFYDFSEHLFQKTETIYGDFLTWGLRHKKAVIGFFSAIFILSLFLIPMVGTEFIPEEDTGDLRITVSMAIGTRLEISEGVAERIEKIIKEDIPEVLYYYVRCGQVPGIGRSFGNQSGTHIVTAGAKLQSKGSRQRSVKDIAQTLRKKISGIPGVLKTDVSTGNPIGRLITGGGGKDVQIEVIGNSFEETDQVAEAIKRIMEKTQGAVDISISRELNRPEFRIIVDREKAASMRLDMRTIADSLKAFLAGTTASRYREKGNTYDISVRLREEDRQRLSDIRQIGLIPLFRDEEIELPQGLTPVIALENIAQIEEKRGPEEIERKNRERVVSVQCNTYKRSTGQVTDDIKRAIDNMTIPAGIFVELGGEAEEQRKAFADLLLLFILGVILVYMVMAAQFESLLDPLIIMFSVPFSLTGVLVGFLITGVTLSVISFLGLVMLTGIVVNNAIVLVSYINILRARGYSMMEAVSQGGKDRLRPVLMTTITTLVGLLPLALSQGEGSESWKPLGVTMLGGLSVSTLITLIYVPVMYAVFESRFKKNGNDHLSKTCPVPI